MIDKLESRMLLTANLQADGTLQITSSFINDVYTITMNATIITVSTAAEGFNAQYPRTGAGRVQRINLNTPNGTNNPPGVGDSITITDPTSVNNHALGIPITIDSSERDDTITITGSGDASITSNDGEDIIFCGGGDDIVRAGDGRAQGQGGVPPDGDDIIYGGAGNDQLFGEGSPGGGNDRPGDVLIGQAGNDTLAGGPGRDLLDGGTGLDFISYADHTADVELFFPGVASATYNPLNPLAFNNYPLEGSGQVNNNRVQQEHDQLYSGLDTVTFDDGLGNMVHFGEASPLLGTVPDMGPQIYSTQVVAILSDGQFEGIQGGNSANGPLDDVIDVSLSTAAPWTIFGNNGIDDIFGSPNNDVIDGGAGADFIDGLAGNDTVTGGDGSDFLRGDGELIVTDPITLISTITETTGNDSMIGDAGNDTVWGGPSDDTLNGGAGNDLLVGDTGQGSSDVDPTSGNDFLDAGVQNGDGAGADTLQGDGGMDTADYSQRTTEVHVTFDTVHDDGATGEGDFVTESTEIGIGGSGNDTLDGRFDNVGRVLNGGPGNDTLVSGQGPDTMIGGDGGRDVADYSARTNPVAVTFDGQSNDGDPTLNNGGPAGENDNVDNTVEVVLTSGGSTGGGGGPSQAPDAPSGLSATVLSSTSIKLKWRDNSTDEDEFVVIRRKVTDLSYTTVGHLMAGVTQFTDTGLTPSTTYVYRVRASNTAGDSAFADLVKATTQPAGFLVAPSNLTVTSLSGTSKRLNWKDNSDNEAGFHIERADAGTTAFVEIGTSNPGVATFTDSTTASGKFYVYRVRAFNLSGVSAYSNTATTDLAQALATATRFEVQAIAPDKIRLTWRDNANIETAYQIYRAFGDPNDDFVLIGTIPANSKLFTDTKLNSKTKYRYRIRATDGTNSGAFSRVASDTTLKLLQTVPKAPTALQGTATSSSSIRLTWKDNSTDNTSFQIERASSLDGTFVAIDTVGADKTSYTDKSLDNGVTYFYRIRARKGTIRSETSGILGIKTLG